MDSDFKPMDEEQAPLYGPRKIMLAGFSAAAQPNVLKLLEMAGLTDLPTVWVSLEDGEEVVSHIFEREDRSGWGSESQIPRAIVVAGILQSELRTLMQGTRATGMRPPLWAVLTPTSEKWQLKTLIGHLVAEREALGQGR